MGQSPKLLVESAHRFFAIYEQKIHTTMMTGRMEAVVGYQRVEGAAESLGRETEGLLVVRSS